MKSLVSVDWLAEQLESRAEDLLLIDFRWLAPGTKMSGRERYERGHIPGAVFVDLDRDVSGDSARGPGRHPIPSAEVFESAMVNAGLGRKTDVVIYDDAGGSIAARLWWLLRLFGHQGDVALLDGGLAAWEKSGHALSSELPQPLQPSEPFVAAEPDANWFCDRTVVQRELQQKSALVLDARAGERYRGEVEPFDARAGHIPGAISAPWMEMTDSGHFRSAEEIAARLAAIGVSPERPTITYCGSGVTACHLLFALHLIGYPQEMTRLYEGSWSDWAKQKELVCATGSEPGG